MSVLSHIIVHMRVVCARLTNLTFHVESMLEEWEHLLLHISWHSLDAALKLWPSDWLLKKLYSCNCMLVLCSTEGGHDR